MRLSLVLCICASVLITPPVGASVNFADTSQDDSRIAPPAARLPDGEFLEYDVYWMGIHVGLGTLEARHGNLADGRPVYQFTAVARTNDFLSKLFPVRDEIRSTMDAQTLCSLEFGKTVSEGRYRADERIRYDYNAGQAHYTSIKNQTQKSFPIGACVQDFLSAFYWYRLQEVRVGRSVKTVINDEDKNWDLEVKCLRRESQELRGSRVVEVFITEPVSRYKGVLYKRGRAWVHFTADERRVPVFFRLTTPYGPVTAALKSAN